MNGGIVTEVANLKGKPGVLFIDCLEWPRGQIKPKTLSILVEKTHESEQVEFGDSISWFDDAVYWTSKDESMKEARIGKLVKLAFRHPREKPNSKDPYASEWPV